MRSQTTTLQHIIAERIQREGPLTFADYMRMALYEPGYGYYVTGPAKMGWEGDYYTSTDVSVLFAHCMGRQLVRMWEQLGRPDPFTVLEQGAGRGDLAYQVRSWAAQEAPEFEGALVYHTEDIHMGQDALAPRPMKTVQVGDREGQYRSEKENPNIVGTGLAPVRERVEVRKSPVRSTHATHGRTGAVGTGLAPVRVPTDGAALSPSLSGIDRKGGEGRIGLAPVRPLSGDGANPSSTQRHLDIVGEIAAGSGVEDLRTADPLRVSSPLLEQPRVILANELIDAFPVHVVEKRGGILYEVYVDIREGRLCAVLGKINNEEVASYLDKYKIPWSTYEDGWRAEINLAAVHWMEQVVRLLVGPNPKRKRRGFLLTIDYGDTARELYTPYRRHGTLASYFRHQFTEQPLARPGEQDLTAHVNFTALIQAGRRYGLRLATLTTQRQWLTDLQIYEELEQVRRDEFAVLDQARASDEGQVALLKWYNLRQRVMALTARGGMGDFKVLIMKR